MDGIANAISGKKKKMPTRKVFAAENLRTQTKAHLTGGLDRSLAGGVLLRIPPHPPTTSPTMASVFSTDPSVSSLLYPATEKDAGDSFGPAARGAAGNDTGCFVQIGAGAGRA